MAGHRHHHRSLFARGLVPGLLLALAAVSLLLLRQRAVGCDCGAQRRGAYLTHEAAAALESGRATEDRPGAPGGGVTVVAAAVPRPGAPADLSLAHLLLPLTGLDNLTTAALLDGAAAAAGAPLGGARSRGLVRLHQELFCSGRLHLPDPPGTARSLFSNVTMLLYSDNDIVSNNLKGAQRSWEGKEVREMLVAMRAPVPSSPAELSTPHLWKPRASPFVVDIGANVGWFTLNAAAAGGTVAAFEAMSSNIRLLRSSLCLNPWIMDRVALYGTGLGTKPSKCYVLSGTINKGDGHTLCDKDPHEAVKEWKANTGLDYEVRGEMSLMRLDGLVQHDVQVLKVDVEGFEEQVLRGAEGLLQRHNVWYIMAECNIDIVKEAGRLEFLKFMDSMGYYLSSYSFTGPFLNVADVRAGKVTYFHGVNVFAVSKKLHDASNAGKKGQGSGPSLLRLGSGRRRALSAAGDGAAGAGAGAA